MKIKQIIPALILTLIFPMSAFAISTPIVDDVPSSMDADFYTLKIHTEIGAKIAVIGGPADLPPVTDGMGSDVADGYVEILVGLAQNQTNSFSVIASKGMESSDSIIITIDEKVGSGTGHRGDTTPPSAPEIDDYPADFAKTSMLLSGSTESNAKIYAHTTTNDLVGTATANNSGYFSLSVALTAGKTNRINVSAEDAAGNKGLATQIIVRVPADAVVVTPAPTSGSTTIDEPVEDAEPDTESNDVETQDLASPGEDEVYNHPFTDVVSHWSEAYVTQLYHQEVVGGKTETTFDPNGQLTRAELIKMVISAFGYSIPTNLSEKPFSDVEITDWFAPYLDVAKRELIATGYDDGTFKPNELINRAAALKMLIGGAGLDFYGYEESFGDVKDSDWFKPYVAFAQSKSIVGGYEDGTFRPGNLITRAEGAKILVKLLELKNQ